MLVYNVSKDMQKTTAFYWFAQGLFFGLPFGGILSRKSRTPALKVRIGRTIICMLFGNIQWYSFINSISSFDHRHLLDRHFEFIFEPVYRLDIIWKFVTIDLNVRWFSLSHVILIISKKAHTPTQRHRNLAVISNHIHA